MGAAPPSAADADADAGRQLVGVPPQPGFGLLEGEAVGDPLAVALGNEPVSVDGRVCGRVTSGGYGYTVGRSIAYAYLPAGAGPGTDVELDLFGTPMRGEVVEEPLFDPKGERVRNLDGALASG